MRMLVKSVHMQHMSKAATTQRVRMFTDFLLRQRNLVLSDSYLKAKKSGLIRIDIQLHEIQVCKQEVESKQ